MHEWKGFHKFSIIRSHKFNFIKKRIAMINSSVSAVVFYKQFLAYTVHIDWCYRSIDKDSCRTRHIPISIKYMHL